MNGTTARKLSADFSKTAKGLLKIGNLEDLQNLLNQVSDLQEYANERENFYKYEDETPVADNETPESWRFEKANESLTKTLEKLTDYISEKEEVLDARIQRKREEKLNKGWL